MLRPEDVILTCEHLTHELTEFRAEAGFKCVYRTLRPSEADPETGAHAAVMVFKGVWDGIYGDIPRRLMEVCRDIYEATSPERVHLAERLRARLKGIALEMAPPDWVPKVTPRPKRVHCRHCQIVKHEQTERAKTCPLSRTGYHEFRGH